MMVHTVHRNVRESVVPLKQMRGIVWRSLLPLADQLFSHIPRLEQQDWYAFRQQIDFEESFCKTEEEVRELRLVKSEANKESFPGAGYQSPFLNQLRQQSAEWLAKHPSLIAMYPFALVRSAQEYAELIATDASEFSRLRKPFLEREHQLRCDEINRFSTEITGSGPFKLDDRNDRTRAYQVILANASVLLGFEYDQRRSKRNFPVFSKTLSQSWTLLILFDRANLMRGVLSMDAARVRSALGCAASYMKIGVCPTNRFKLSVSDPEVVQVALDRFVPIDDSFRDFWDFRELERNIRGYMQGYGLIASQFEAAISSIV